MSLLLVFNSAIADSLEFINGKTLQGKFIGRSNGMVQFEVDGITGNYAEKDVKNMSFGSANKQTSKTSNPKPKPIAKTASGSVTVTAGTLLHVRTKESLSTKKHKTGDKFTAELEADLVVNGVVAVPRGAKLYGVITSSKQARRLRGKSEMTLSFTGIMINNQIKPISSGVVKAIAEQDEAKNTVGKTARFAAIGALADGSSGAKTGAKIGLGVSLLTKGGSIEIPTGTLLELPLAAALNI